MALSANTDLARLVNGFGATHSYPMAAVHIYRNAAVGLDRTTGYCGPLATTTYNRFIGIAAEEVDNSSTADPAGVAGGGNGPIEVYDLDGEEFVLAVSGIAVTDVGKPIYASADNTFTLTQTSATPFIGYVTGYESSGYARVRIKPYRYDYGTVTVELKNTAGTSAVHTLTFPQSIQVVSVYKQSLAAPTASGSTVAVALCQLSGGNGTMTSAFTMAGVTTPVSVALSGTNTPLISAAGRLYLHEKGVNVPGRGTSVTVNYIKVQRL